MAQDLDVGMKCIKYMLFVSNFMFVMIGFLLISIGTSIKAIYEDFDVFMENHYFSPAALLIAIGIIIFIVAFFGCFGAIRESTCMVNLYSLMLAFILILEISAAIAAYAMRNNLSYRIEQNIGTVMDEYREGSESVPTEAMDFLQARLQCCGISSYKEWAEGNYSVSSSNTWSVPESCCMVPDCADIYEDGCLNRLSYIISQCAILLGSGALCVAFVQLLGVIFSHMLAGAVRRLKTEAERQKQEARQQFYAQLVLQKNEKNPEKLFAAEQSEA